MSDRAAATIASAALYDLGIITDEDAFKVIDRSKVRRARSKMRESSRSNVNEDHVQGLYFDGRKDKTMVNEKEDDGKYHRRVMVEEHIVVVREPGSEYFCHLTASSGSSKVIDALIENETERACQGWWQLVAMGPPSIPVVRLLAARQRIATATSVTHLGRGDIWSCGVCRESWKSTDKLRKTSD